MYLDGQVQSDHSLSFKENIWITSSHSFQAYKPEINT